MKQLTFGDILEFAEILRKEKGLTEAELKELPVYIGDDDELNGIHSAWNCSIVDSDDEEDAWCVEMINERSGNYELECGDSAILIS
jgi:hypothetical protein